MILKKLSLYLDVINIKEIEPDLSSKTPLGYFDRGRGGTYFLNAAPDFSFVGIIEFDQEKGPRGHHKHNQKIEYFFILEGTLKGTYWLENDSEAYQEIIHEPDTLIIIKPDLFHTFESITKKTRALEFSPQSFDLKDTFYPS